MIDVEELIGVAKQHAGDFLKDVAGRTAVKIAGTPVGEEAIKAGLTGFLTSEEIREQTAEAAARETVELKNQIKIGTEPFLKNAANEMGVTSAPAWRQIYDRISTPHDFFLLKPVKGLFALILSGVANAASFFTVKAVNTIVKPGTGETIATQDTVKSVFIGLFNKAFGFLRPRTA